MAFVIVIRVKINRVALASALRHAKNVDEEAQTFFGFRREQLQMSQMRHVSDGFGLHKRDSNTRERVQRGITDGGSCNVFRCRYTMSSWLANILLRFFGCD